ncbi:hypothetical protein ACLB1E_20345 [Escherichia coli]
MIVSVFSILQEDAQILEKEYGIPRRYLGTIMSPWAERRNGSGGDMDQFW